MSKLVPSHRELLTVLIEECSEVQKCATKALRFGYLGIEPGQSFNNYERITEEVGDLMGVIDLAIDKGLIDGAQIDRLVRNKREKLSLYLSGQVGNPPQENA